MEPHFIKVPVIGKKGFVKAGGAVRECEVFGGVCDVENDKVTLILEVACRCGGRKRIRRSEEFIYSTPEDCEKGVNPVKATRYQASCSVINVLMKGKNFTWTNEHPWSVLRFRWNGKRPAVKTYRLPYRFFIGKAKSCFLRESNFGRHKYATVEECVKHNGSAVRFCEPVRKTAAAVITFTRIDCV